MFQHTKDGIILDNEGCTLGCDSDHSVHDTELGGSELEVDPRLGLVTVNAHHFGKRGLKETHARSEACPNAEVEVL